MLSLPKIQGIIEIRRLDCCRVLPLLPIRPSFTKVPRISEHVSTIRFVSVLVMPISVSDATLVIIVLREDHNIIGSALPQEKVIGSLDRNSK